MNLVGSLAAIFLVLGINAVVLVVVRHIQDWSLRRTLQLCVLLMPLVMLGLGLCSFGLSFHALFPVGALFFLMGGIALGALGLGMIRLILMVRLVARYRCCTNPELQRQADAMMQRLGGKGNTPCVRLYTSDRPHALTWGFRRPMILLSSWMIEHLDRRELEAVLVHELEHVARHDYLMMWLAMMLRDAFFYLPTSWIAYRQLQQEKELACDDGAVHVTHRPLALASALTKVWLQAVDEPALVRFEGVQALTAAESSIDERIKRLLAPSASASMSSRRHSRCTRFRLHMAAFLPLGVFEAACLFFLLLSTVVGCHPIAMCGRLI